jgi:hypothetical protein
MAVHALLNFHNDFAFRKYFVACERFVADTAKPPKES